MNLLFQVADVFGVTLDATKTSFYGKQSKIVNIGPVQAKVTMEVFADVMRPDEVGAFARFSPRLWQYYTSSGEEQMICIFNAEVAGVTAEKVGKFGAISCSDTLMKLRSAITEVYVYEKKKWSRVRAEDLDQYLPQQDILSLSPCTQAKSQPAD